MSESEEKIIETIAKAVPKMSEFDKGYLLGVGENIINSKKKKGENENGSNDSRNSDTGKGV